MERLTEYRVPKGGMQRKYPCFSPNIIPDDNCPQSVFCEKAKQCNFVHISSRKCPYLQVIDRLAAYEDTGLEPGEVVAMKIVLLGRELAKITDVDGVSINRICELAQAEKDGRLVVLPPNDPLTLDELREMDGEPVWGAFSDGSGRYMIIQWHNSEFFKTFECGFLLLEEYGKTWRAYRRKPEEVGTC